MELFADVTSLIQYSFSMCGVGFLCAFITSLIKF